MKSFLTFQKWTKINVQNRVDKNSLTDKKFRLEDEILSCQMKPKFIILL
jgi:hypothetical protein